MIILHACYNTEDYRLQFREIIIECNAEKTMTTNISAHMKDQHLCLGANFAAETHSHTSFRIKKNKK